MLNYQKILNTNKMIKIIILLLTHMMILKNLKRQKKISNPKEIMIIKFMNYLIRFLMTLQKIDLKF